MDDFTKLCANEFTVHVERLFESERSRALAAGKKYVNVPFLTTSEWLLRHSPHVIHSNGKNQAGLHLCLCAVPISIDFSAGILDSTLLATSPPAGPA